MGLTNPLLFGRVGFHGAWATAALLLFLLKASADDASQFFAPPPAVYKDKLAKLLTPLDDVLKKQSDFNKLQGDGIVLVDETVSYLNEDGKRITVYHAINKALNDAGVQSLAQDTFYFKKKLQRVYLVSAHTVQPDGTQNPVKSDAVFLKMPQTEADDSVYDDGAEMVSVYSNVKPGSITESTIVLEDMKPRIPGQYSQTYTWNGSWPEYLQRLTVDLPQSYASRLKVTNLGTDVPSPTTAAMGSNRQRWTWEKLNTPSAPPLDTDPPAYQAGPLVWLSTLDSWDSFVAWYSDLVKGTITLSPPLKAKIDGWTKDAKSPAETLRILYQHVAQDVRYTGFELGKADLQPHDCMSVWDQQYGDCKDKANLLRAMLAYKNVPAWLVLLSTEHSGDVNKASPDYRQFNHCILAAQVDGAEVLCDPTITYGAPGVLSGRETDRDVLVIKDKAEWLHVPAFHNAQISYSFDLQLRPSGELAGWMTMNATGYYGSYNRKSFQDLSKQQTISTLQDDVRGIFPNANVVDFQTAKDGAPDSSGVPPFSIRAYMVLTGVLNQGDGPTQLKFPAPDILLPDIGNYKERERPTFTWPDTQNISCHIALPAGWTAPTVPPPLTYDSSEGSYQAAWTASPNTLSADCTVTLKQALYPADQMHTLGDALTNLKSWASQTLALTKSGTPAPAAPAQTDSQLADHLPVMPTGEGQLNLIDSELPEDGNVNARRAALQRVPTLFPSDQKAIVEAAIKLAVLDLDDNKWSDSLSRLRPILEANRAALDDETIAWAEYIIGCALNAGSKSDEALALFKKISENSAVSSGRRGWSIYEAAKIMADKSPVAALDYADKGLGLDSDATPTLYGLYASVGVRSNNADRVKDRLKKLIAAKPTNLEDILLETSNSAQNLIETGHKTEGLALVDLLASISDPATTGDAFAKALKKVRDKADSLADYAKVQQEIKDALLQFPDIAALEKKLPAFASLADASKSQSQDEDNSEPNEALGCSLRMAIGYPVDNDFPVYFWDCVKDAEWGMRNTPVPPKEPFFFKLASLDDDLLHSTDAYADTKLLQAKILEKNGARSDAGAIYDSLIKETDLSDGFQGSIFLRNGTNWEEQGNETKALASYQSAEAFVDDQTSAQEAVLRAAFIQFDKGNKTEVARLIQVLSQAVQKGKIKAAEQIQNVVVLGPGGTESPAFWDNWQAWWPQWQQIETEAGLDPVKDKKVIPVIPSLLDFVKSLGAAKNDKDTKEFFGLMRQTAYAARFYPNAALEFVGVFNIAEEMLPDHANDLRLLGISILQPMVVSDPDYQRRRVLNLLINYVDSNQSDKALALMNQDWKPAIDNGSDVALAVHRVWGLAAIRQHQDLDKVRDVLEKDLKVASGGSYSQAVNMLAQVYSGLGRPQDAEQLIKATLANPAVAGDDSAQQGLKTLLDNLQNTSAASKQLSDGVAAWLKNQKPPWWDYAEPKSAIDPRLGRLDEILKNPQGEFQPAEMVKAGLLAPSVDSLSSATQEQAVLKAFNTLLESCSTQDKADALAQSIFDNPSFPQSLKTDFLYSFLLDADENRQVASFQKFEKLPLEQTLSDPLKAVLQRIDSFGRVDKTSASALKDYVQVITAHPMDDLNLAIVEETVTDLLTLGDIDSAQAIYQGAAKDTLAPNATRTRPEFQLKLLKAISFSRQVKPVTDALRQIVLAAYKPEDIAKPDFFDLRRTDAGLSDLSPEDATKVRLYLIKTHQESEGLDFWYEFMRDLPHDPAGTDLRLALLKGGLQSSVSDDQKAELVSFGISVLDMDDLSTRQHFVDLVQPYRDPAKFPQAMENIRMFDVSTALRLGNPVNLETDLQGFTTSPNVNEATRMKLRAYRQTKNVGRLKDILNNLSADEIVSPALVEETLPALEAAGLNDEATLARDTLNQKLYQDVLAAWFKPTGRAIVSVERDIEGLGTTKDIPAGFFDFAGRHVAGQRQLLGYQLESAYLEKNWNAASVAGASFTQAYPTFYTMYWFYGRSLAELGKKDEAIKALTVYCKYSKDEIWYGEATQLLASLQAGPK